MVESLKMLRLIETGHRLSSSNRARRARAVDLRVVNAALGLGGLRPCDAMSGWGRLPTIELGITTAFVEATGGKLADTKAGIRQAA